MITLSLQKLFYILFKKNKIVASKSKKNKPPSSTNSLPLKKGKRNIYIYVENTVLFPHNNRTQKVTRRLSTNLQSAGENVYYVKWDSKNDQCIFISMQERQHLAKWNGPVILKSEHEAYSLNEIQNIPFLPHAMGENNWFIVPEATHITNHKCPVTLNLLQWSRRNKLTTGFIYYDAMPLRQMAVCSEYKRYTKYMQHLLLADVVWPISQGSMNDLFVFWKKSEYADIKTMPDVILTPLPTEASHYIPHKQKAPQTNKKLILSIADPKRTWSHYGTAIRKQIENKAHPEKNIGKIYYWIDIPLHATRHKTIQRVSQQLVRELVAMNVELIPVKWNSTQAELTSVEHSELAIFSKQNSINIASWHRWVKPNQTKKQDWFFMSGLPLKYSFFERTQFFNYIQKHKLHSAAIFYGTTWTTKQPNAKNSIEIYQEYIIDLSKYDLILPISTTAQETLTDFLGEALPRPQGLNSKIKRVILPKEPPENKHITTKIIKQPLRSWHDYSLEITIRLMEKSLTPPKTDTISLSDLEINVCAQELKLKTRPKLSICISTYNRAERLATSLKNWAALYPKALPEVEVLVCDNASTDQTPETVKPYLDRVDFSYHRNAFNVGMLGNLRETAHHANGKYIWIIGDDDLLMPQCIETIIEAIQSYKNVSLVYLNYAYTRIEDTRNITNINNFFNSALPIVPAEPNLAGPIKAISARNENFFTAIYTLVLRRDHAIKAYSQDTSGRPFSTMLTCIPTTYYILNHMMDEQGVWLGTPQLVVNMNVSWLKYAPLWILERIPEVYELAEERGVPAEQVDRWRKHTLTTGVLPFFKEIFENDPLNNAQYLCPERVIRRFKHLPEITPIYKKLRKIYSRAYSHNHPAAIKPIPVVFPKLNH